MDEQLTATLSPALSHIIERPRLIDRIREADARVVFFVAPAGYGKTTLARQWSERQTGPVVWHRTTRASGDIAALAVRLDDALDAAVPQPHRDPRRVASIASVNPHPTPLSRALVATYAGLTDDVLLIVDEWEAAGTPEAEELLRTLVEELKIRFLLTSRTRPPWFTSRLKVYGEALEIGMDELTMTDEEAAAALAGLTEPTSLLTTARGWPAIIGLAALQAATRMPAEPLAARTLYDFLAGELLDAAPTEVEESIALLAASSTADVETARILLGEQTDDLLRIARERGLLHIDEDSRLILHPLLRSVLLSRLRGRSGTVDPTLLAQLHRLLAAERWDESLEASEALPDATFVSTALAGVLPRLLHSGRLATLRRWAAVGRVARADEALVAYAEGEIALRDSELDRAIALGERAASGLERDLASRAHLLVARAANLTDRADRAREHITLAQSLAETSSSRAAALWARFIQAIDDETPDARLALDEFVAAALPTSDQQIRAAQGKIALALIDGALDDALGEGAVAASLIDPVSDPMVCTSFFNNYSAALSLSTRYEQALWAADRELDLADACDFEFVRRHGLINRSRALVGLRQIPAAEQALRHLERRLHSDGDDFLWANLAIERSRLYISIGDLERALGALFSDAEFRVGLSTCAERLALRALLFAALGTKDRATDDGAAATAMSRHTQVRGLASVANCVAALAAGSEVPTSGRDTLDAIRRSCSLDAVVIGYRAFPPLAEWLAEDMQCRDVLGGLLTRSRDTTLARRVGLMLPRSARRSVQLSPRELEIHGLIGQGLTNQEISKLLFISESTTKVHVRHVLEKLGVRSRVEAARIWQAPEDEGA